MAVMEATTTMDRECIGDGTALNEFVQQHYPTFSNWSTKMMGGRAEDAAEVTNDAFNKLIAEANKGVTVSEPMKFLKTVARRKAINLAENVNAQKRNAISNVPITHAVAELLTEHLPTERVKESVTDALDVLDDEERAVIDSLYYGNRSHAQTVGYLGYSLYKVRKLEESALKKMRGELAEEFE